MTLSDVYWRQVSDRLTLEEIERFNAVSPNAVHLPTFVWSVLAVIVGLIIYHLLFGGPK